MVSDKFVRRQFTDDVLISMYRLQYDVYRFWDDPDEDLLLADMVIPLVGRPHADPH